MNDFSHLNDLDRENMKVVGFERKNRLTGRSADIAAGADWHGNRVPDGNKYARPVLYVAAEGGRGIRSRVEAMRKHNPDMMAALEESGNLPILSQPLDLCTANVAQYLLEAIREGFEVMPLSS